MFKFFVPVRIVFHVVSYMVSSNFGVLKIGGNLANLDFFHQEQINRTDYSQKENHLLFVFKKLSIQKNRFYRKLFLILLLVLKLSHLSHSHVSSTFSPFSFMYTRLISFIFLFYYLIQYPDMLGRDELLDRNRSGSNIPLLRTLFSSDHNIRQH